MSRWIIAMLALASLLIAFQLGVTAAGGQGQQTVVFADDPGGGSVVVTNIGDVYYATYPPSGSGQWSLMGHIPSSSPIVTIHTGYDTNIHAFAQNGDFYTSPDNGATWQLSGNVFAGPTAARRSTWGGIKGRYH
jgi:hypothetical protein